MNEGITMVELGLMVLASALVSFALLDLSDVISEA
jgi:hypothetical protein